MVEDHVTGTSSGYDQKNYYSSSSQNVALNGAGHNWQNEPNPVPAANMVYDHVGRALLGGYTGQTGSVSTTITDGQTATYQFTYTVPATSVRNNMHAVVLLIDQATGEVINAKSIPAGSAGITETAIENMAVYPNPASEAVTVSFDGKGGDYAITITDLSGRIVSSQTISANGTTQVSVSVADLNTGNYLISVANATGSHTQNLLVK
jgi:hypothetical protein